MFKARNGCDKKNYCLEGGAFMLKKQTLHSTHNCVVQHALNWRYTQYKQYFISWQLSTNKLLVCMVLFMNSVTRPLAGTLYSVCAGMVSQSRNCCQRGG